MAFYNMKLIFSMVLYAGSAQGCGGVLNTTTGELRSLDADGNGQYENNLDCHWTIVGETNKVIKLNIWGMAIENNPTCMFDYLRVCN